MRPYGFIFMLRLVHMETQKLFLQQYVYPSNALPNKRYADDFLKPCSCSSCKIGNLYYYDADYHKELATFAYKCTNCSEVTWLTFSPFLQNKKYGAGHLISLNRHNDLKMKEQLVGLNCRTCDTQLKKFKSDEEVANRLNIGKFSSDILFCENGCEIAQVLIFWIPPNQYFKRVLHTANQIKDCNEAKLTMYLSALETYFEKVFLFSGYQGGKINPQNLNKIKDCFQEHFQLRLIDHLITNQNWSILQNRYSDRHSIVHRGGYNKVFEPVSISDEQIETTEKIINNFVEEINQELTKQYLF